MRIILPKTLCEVDPLYGPFFFLAGPIRGGGDWQRKCIDEISLRMPHFYAALPCRYDQTHPLSSRRMPGVEDQFEHQLSWERRYLSLAAYGFEPAAPGCLIFWLPCESRSNPRTGEGSYAMDTRGELGEWRGRMMSNHRLNVVVGAEAGFPGLSQIQRNFNEALNCDFPIYPTLERTVIAAIGKSTKSNG